MSKTTTATRAVEVSEMQKENPVIKRKMAEDGTVSDAEASPRLRTHRPLQPFDDSYNKFNAIERPYYISSSSIAKWNNLALLFLAPTGLTVPFPSAAPAALTSSKSNE